LKRSLSLISFLLGSAVLLPGFTIDDSSTTAILISPDERDVVQTAGGLLASDITRVTGGNALVIAETSPQGSSETPLILAGTEEGNSLIRKLSDAGKLDLSEIRGKWESFVIREVSDPLPGVGKALVIAGSDPRGTAYGLLKISELMGVSPFYWWADVPAVRQNRITLNPGRIVQGPPSVRYRGIFLNDEDWGLRPWAAENMDPEVNNIGPNTYSRIFELLLRLKANTIWPAMHEGTSPFFTVDGNKEAADRYGILISTSHCEPMLRNNVEEWKFFRSGSWNYKRNSENIRRYWEERIAETADGENIYTVGMRGIHDGSMPGGGSRDEKTLRLEQVIQDQRTILEKYHGAPGAVPQIFIPYKEVLDLYRNDLSLPGDITLVWADDNHGYLRQLSNEEEQKRSGKSGVYYHLSYWGSPEDYLWLSTISPALIYYEMHKAMGTGADRFWIFNVGDIKPAELEMQFALDLAYDTTVVSPDSLKTWIRTQTAELFGDDLADRITALRLEHYRLAAAGKPEHQLHLRYSHHEESDRAGERINACEALLEETDLIGREIPEELQDAWYQLIEYPVKGAALMNLKFLYTERAALTKRDDRNRSRDFARRAEEAFREIQILTDRYNSEISGGKWKGMMSWHPRNRKVYKMPRRRQAMTEHTGHLHDAASWQSARGSGNYEWKVFKGLGPSGRAAGLFPASDWHSLEGEPPALLTYELEVPGTGEYDLEVRCLPTHPLYTPLGLEYGVTFEGGEETRTEIEAEAETREWKTNVLRGYSSRTFPFTAEGSGTIRFRITVYDPGIVFDSLAVIPVIE